MVSSICLVNGNSVTNGFNTTAGATITISLQDKTDISQWSIQCTSTDELNTTTAVNATLVINSINFTATVVIPSTTTGSALQFTSIVNNDISTKSTFGVFVLAPTNTRLMFPGEIAESSPQYGVVADINAPFRNATIIAGAVTLSGDVSGQSNSNTVDKIKNKNLDASLSTIGAGQDGYVLTWVNSAGDWQAKSPVAGTPIGPAGGDLSGTYPNPTVTKIDGASVPIAGSLTTGNVLQVNGAASLTYAPVNLAGGANYVTGTLPAVNQAAQTMGGDVTGTTAASVVTKANGATIPVAGALTTGNVLQVSGTSTLSYGAVNLAGGSNYVTGVLPIGNQAAQNMSGDVTGTTAASTVLALRGKSLNATLASVGAPQDGYLLTWVNSANDWQAKPNNFTGSATPTGTAGGDLSGTYPNPVVAKIQTNSVDNTVLGATQDGYLATWDNSLGKIKFKPNNFNGTVTLSGDVTGLSNTNSVVKIQNKTLASSLTSIGATQDGYVLTWINANSDWEAKPAGSGGSVTLSGDVTGPSNANTVSAISGSSPINITPANLNWLASVTSPKISQTAATSDVAPQNLQITPQPPFASASTNKNSGNLLLNITGETGTNVKQGVGFTIKNGANTVFMSGIMGLTGANGGIWFQNGGPASTDFNIGGNSSQTWLNAPTGGSIFIGTGGSLSGNYSITVTTLTTFKNGEVHQTTNVAAGTNLTINDTTFVVLVDTSGVTPSTITLPTPVAGRIFTIKDAAGNAGANNITIARHGTEKIDGTAANLVLSTNWIVQRLISNGTDWFLI